jgi:hypothetical protein
MQAVGPDNNLTRKISSADPLQIVALKGLVAGHVNLLLGLAASGALPNLVPSLLAGGVGFLCYGVSLVLFVLALRQLGAAERARILQRRLFLGLL